MPSTWNKQLEKVAKSVIMNFIQRKWLKVNKKVYNNVMSGKCDNNIHFTDFQNLIVDLGFCFIRQNGSHKQYYNKGINERMTIQNNKGKAKGYQIKQLRNIITKHGL